MKSFLKYILIALAVAAMPVSAFSSQVEIVIPAEVEVSGELVKLGDIASIKGEEGPVKAIGDLTLGRSAAAGTYRVLKAKRIENFLSRNGWHNTTLAAPESIKVWRSAYELKSEIVAEEVKRTIDAKMPWPKGIAIVDVSVPGGSMSLANGNLSVVVDVPEKFGFIGEEHVKVDIYVSSEKVKTIWAKTDIKVYKDIVMAARPILRNEVIGDSDVRVERILLSTLRQESFSKPSDIVGMRAKGAIHKGAMITENDIALPPVINRGSLVEIRYQKGAVTVSTKGKALERGYIGKLVKVENVNSSKVLVAEVLDSKTVVVSF